MTMPAQKLAAMCFGKRSDRRHSRPNVRLSKRWWYPRLHAHTRIFWRERGHRRIGLDRCGQSSDFRCCRVHKFARVSTHTWSVDYKISSKNTRRQQWSLQCVGGPSALLVSMAIGAIRHGRRPMSACALCRANRRDARAPGSLHLYAHDGLVSRCLRVRHRLSNLRQYRHLSSEGFRHRTRQRRKMSPTPRGLWRVVGLQC
jgi:hypothetical protein